MVDHEIFVKKIDKENKTVLYLRSYRNKKETAEYYKNVEKHLERAMKEAVSITAHFNWFDKISKIHYIGSEKISIS